MLPGGGAGKGESGATSRAAENRSTDTGVGTMLGSAIASSNAYGGRVPAGASGRGSGPDGRAAATAGG
jgi:hypothetical protein